MGSTTIAAPLTPQLVSPGDLKKVRRELADLDEFLHQSGIRQGGKAVKLPTLSRVLSDLASDNKLNLLKAADRERLHKYLTLLINKAPVLHMSFASEPSGTFLGKLVVWLRANIHPQLTISIGLQPSITAGCIVRGANRQFDFSLRQSFETQRDLMMKVLRESEPKTEKAAEPIQ